MLIAAETTCTWITIPMTTAALDFQFELGTLDGKKDVTIDPGTQPNDDIVLEGQGSVTCSAQAVVPCTCTWISKSKKLDDQSRELLEKLAR